MWSRSYYLLRACKSSFPHSASIYGRVRAMWSRSYYLLRACKSRFPRPASIYGRVRAMWSRSYYLLRVCKAASRTRLRYMVECGQCGAAHTTCCEAVRHLPAINSDIWLMAGQQPVTKPESRQKNIFPRLTLIYGSAREAPRIWNEPPRLRGGEQGAGAKYLNRQTRFAVSRHAQDSKSREPRIIAPRKSR